MVGEPIQPVKLFKLRASQACVKFSLSFNSWCLVDRGLVKVRLRPNWALKTPTITYSALITLIVIQLVELECAQLKLSCAILDARACFMKIGEFLCIYQQDNTYIELFYNYFLSFKTLHLSTLNLLLANPIVH